MDTQIEVVGAEPVAGVPSNLPGDAPLLLSVPAAAKALGLSRGSVYELIARGEIEHLRIGRRILVPRERLVAFVEANSSTGR